MLMNFLTLLVHRIQLQSTPFDAPERAAGGGVSIFVVSFLDKKLGICKTLFDGTKRFLYILDP